MGKSPKTKEKKDYIKFPNFKSSQKILVSKIKESRKEK